MENLKEKKWWNLWSLSYLWHAFLPTVVPYKVLIYPSPKFGCSTTSANPWISFAGQHGETGVIEIPKGCLEFNVEVCTSVTLAWWLIRDW